LEAFNVNVHTHLRVDSGRKFGMEKEWKEREVLKLEMMI
jgi:hypothetical protein